MSVENLKKYGQMCVENDDVRKKAKEIGVQDIDGQIALAKSLGLEISKEDFEALVKETGLDGKNELSEEELKKVAGGFVTLTATLAAVSCAAVAGVAAAGSAAAVTKPGW
jgi:predicted ribosomally synthesized peptide with nif11-like leader